MTVTSSGTLNSSTVEGLQSDTRNLLKKNLTWRKPVGTRHSMNDYQALIGQTHLDVVQQRAGILLPRLEVEREGTWEPVPAKENWADKFGDRLDLMGQEDLDALDMLLTILAPLGDERGVAVMNLARDMLREQIRVNGEG